MMLLLLLLLLFLQLNVLLTRNDGVVYAFTATTTTTTTTRIAVYHTKQQTSVQQQRVRVAPQPPPQPQQLRSPLYGTTSSLSSSSLSSSTTTTEAFNQQQHVVPETCQLAQLSKMTVLSIDSGDIDLIRQYAQTGYITDATTNPLFVAQTAFKAQQQQQQQPATTKAEQEEESSSSSTSSPCIYTTMVDDAVKYAIDKVLSSSSTKDNDNGIQKSDMTEETNIDQLLSLYNMVLKDTEDDNDDNNNHKNTNTNTNPGLLLQRIVTLSMDRLAVNLGSTIASIVPGYISTEVDPRLSFNSSASVQRALQIVHMYEQDYNLSRTRILIKLAATWEGIMAAKVLQEQYDIQCNLTLIFSVVQAIVCGQYKVHLISPFPGRILDWYKVHLQRSTVPDPMYDEGVIACTYIHNYFKYYNHTTICMPASWRPSRGVGNTVSYDLDEIQALAGTDRMTIPVPLLQQLIQCEEPLPRKLFPTFPTSEDDENPIPPPLLGNGRMTEDEFRYRLTMDGCGNDKLGEGLRSFCDLTEQLEGVMTQKVRQAILAKRDKTSNGMK
jgi:transaldolase